jgi:glucokinase
MDDAVLAADVGGGTIRVARVDARGTIVAHARHATPQDPSAGVALLREAWAALGPARGAAIAIAGGVDPTTGVLTQSPNLPRWAGLDLPAALDGCAVLNDANAALLGEAWRGSLAGRRSAVLLTLGTGIGGALLVGGALWEGAHGVAGEIGHLPVRAEGVPCACGSRGCLERYASATAVAREAGRPNAAEAAEAARGGDERARAAFDAAARDLGIAIAGLANVFDPEAFCLAGGMSFAFDLLEEGIRAQVQRRAFLLARRHFVLVRAALGDDAGLLGAAHRALDRRR